MAKTIGQVAYEKWAELVAWPSTGIVAWQDQHPGNRRKWEEIALVAVNQHIDNKLGESDG